MAWRDLCDLPAVVVVDPLPMQEVIILEKVVVVVVVAGLMMTIMMMMMIKLSDKTSSSLDERDESLTAEDGKIMMRMIRAIPLHEEVVEAIPTLFDAVVIVKAGGAMDIEEATQEEEGEEEVGE